LVIGPNGAGKSTYYRTRIAPRLQAPFINADEIQAQELPGSDVQAAYEAARLATARRTELLEQGLSFVTETVASHSSKLDLVIEARNRGYEVWVTFIYLESADLAVERVARRVRSGGHPVPEHKIRARYDRMAAIGVKAVRIADRAFIVDNSTSAEPLKTLLILERGRETWRGSKTPDWLDQLFPW